LAVRGRIPISNSKPYDIVKMKIAGLFYFKLDEIPANSFWHQVYGIVFYAYENHSTLTGKSHILANE
jgi:hypothetical protein